MLLWGRKPQAVERIEIEPSRCAACGRSFSWLNLILNLGLATLKATVGILSGSRALLANSLYSFNDVLSAVAVLVSLKLARQPADDEHPFGHGKVEFIAIALVSFVLAGSVAFLIYTVLDVGHESESSPSAVAFCVAVLSLGVSELLAQRGFCVAERLNSPALHTSAEHNRADAISSLAVIIGIAGAAAFGWHILDRLIAIYEALDVMRLSGILLGRSLKGLMDSALPREDLDLIRSTCSMLPGVQDVLSVRSRRSGTVAYADVVIAVSEGQSVEQAHLVTARVHGVVREVIGRGVQVQVGFRVGRGEMKSDAEKAGAHA